MGFNDTTLAIPPSLKEEIKSLKIFPRETYAEVLRRLIDDAAKVPELEKENSELRAAKFELEKDNGRLQDDIKQLKEKVKELEDKKLKKGSGSSVKHTEAEDADIRFMDYQWEFLRDEYEERKEDE